jgi:NADPH:quinone reductase-like Zn-dependent oxidoreductase
VFYVVILSTPQNLRICFCFCSCFQQSSLTPHHNRLHQRPRNPSPDRQPTPIVEPNRERLGELAKLLDDGSLKTFVNAAVPLAEAAAAYARKISQRLGFGKVVTLSGGS